MCCSHPARLFALAFLLLWVPWATALGDASEPPAPPADPGYLRAAKLIERGDFRGASALLEKVVAGNPRNADAFNLLGFSTRKLGRYQEALGFYRKALAIDKGHRGAHEYMGETYLALGQPEKAREHLAFLKKDCWLPCEAYTDLKAAIEAYDAGHR